MSELTTSSLIQPLRPALLFSVLAHLLLFVWIMEVELPRPVWTQPLPSNNAITIQLQAFKPVPESQVRLPEPLPAPPPEIIEVVEPPPVLPLPKKIPLAKAEPKTVIPTPPKKTITTSNTKAAVVPIAPKPSKPQKIIPAPAPKAHPKPVEKEKPADLPKVVPKKVKPVVKKPVPKKASKVVPQKSKTVAKKKAVAKPKAVIKQPQEKVQPKPKPATKRAAAPITDTKTALTDIAIEQKNAASRAAVDTPILLTKPDYLQPPAPPRYPARSKRRGEQGTVWLRVLLDGAGAVKKLLIKSSSGFNRLDQSALDAARGWKFKPAVVDGVQRDAWLEIPVHFKLR